MTEGMIDLSTRKDKYARYKNESEAILFAILSLHNYISFVLERMDKMLSKALIFRTTQLFAHPLLLLQPFW